MKQKHSRGFKFSTLNVKDTIKKRLEYVGRTTPTRSDKTGEKVQKHFTEYETLYETAL